MNFNEFEKEMKVRGYSTKTIESYLFYNYKFLKFIGKSPREVSGQDVKEYLNYLWEKRKVKSRTLNLAISALKFYYQEFNNKKLFRRIKRSKEEKKLPLVYSKNEIEAMIENTKNEKHRLLLELMYGSGLRVSECVNLKIEDVDVVRCIGIVRQGKGKKERLFLLSQRFCENFLKYINSREGNNEFVFDKGDGHITVRTAEMIVKNATRKIKLRKNAFPHAFRSSFATHLHDEGIDIYSIQRLLGHSDIGTTQRYLSSEASLFDKIKSPLDSL